jgi:hypothetical protein
LEAGIADAEKALRKSLIVAAVAWVPLTASAGQSRPDAAPSVPPQAPAVGEVVVPFSAAGVDGSSQFIDFPRGSTSLLLFFLSGCPTCHRMIPEWNRAFERKPAAVRVVGVLMDQEPPGFFTAFPIAFPVVRSPGPAFLRNLKVNHAPLTLRISQGGKIEEAVVGLVDPIRLGELFRR